MQSFFSRPFPRTALSRNRVGNLIVLYIESLARYWQGMLGTNALYTILHGPVLVRSNEGTSQHQHTAACEKEARFAYIE